MKSKISEELKDMMNSHDEDMRSLGLTLAINNGHKLRDIRKCLSSQFSLELMKDNSFRIDDKYRFIDLWAFKRRTVMPFVWNPTKLLKLTPINPLTAK